MSLALATQDKRQVLLDRLHLLQLRLARNPLFRRPVFEDPDLKDRSVQVSQLSLHLRRPQATLRMRNKHAHSSDKDLNQWFR